MSGTLADAAFRLLKRLAVRNARLCADAEAGWRLGGAAGPLRVLVPDEVATVHWLQSERMVAADADGHFRLSELGRKALVRRLAGASDGFAVQHRELEQVVLDDEHLGVARVTVNHAESALAWLRRRKDKDGRPLVSAEEYAAGERLRADYERGQLRPRVTANWSAAVASGRRGSNGVVDLTDAAVAARQRVDAAIRALDRELAGPVVDLCCYDKGLEEIGRDHALPARSSKVVIKLGLAKLARYYGLSAVAEGPDWARKLVHWGTEDYRPQVQA